MKLNKSLIAVLVIVFLILAVVVAAPKMFAGNDDYDAALQQARSYYERDLCKLAMNAYDEAMTIEDSIDLRVEMAQVYYRGFQNGEFDSFYKLSDFLYQMIDDYREEPIGYETALTIFAELEETEDCVTVLYQAEDLGVVSEKISQFREEIRYLCDLDLSYYDEVSFVPNNTYLLVTENYAIRNANLKSVTGAMYEYATPMIDGYAVVKSNERVYVVSEENTRYTYLPDDVVFSTGYGQDLIGCQVGETYSYYDMNGQKLFGQYAFAGRFANGIAAVQTEKGWQIINREGDPVVNTYFEDVKLSQSHSCAQFGFVIAKTNGKYHLYDAAMTQLSTTGFDDADVFYTGDGLAACKVGEKWGFMNTSGEIVIKPVYDDARSFSYGLAGVKQGDFWSFINTEGEIVITGEFTDTNYFNNAGGCFVKVDDMFWQYLVRYYNRA